MKEYDYVTAPVPLLHFPVTLSYNVLVTVDIFNVIITTVNYACIITCN